MNKTLRFANINVIAVMSRAGMLLMIVAFLTGCGSKLSGTYNIDKNGGAPFKSLNFTSGSKVELTVAMTGSTTEASYVVEGEKLKISAGGKTQIFTIEKDGSINGGELIGRFVKQ
jgi:outer membrane lipopolysaccharide assembly protein LptE/RlpB